MNIGGLVVGLIAVVWLAYLLPWFLRNRNEAPTDIQATDVGEQMRYVRHADEQDDTELELTHGLEVSTPLLRNAARHQIAAEARTAVRRRRIGLVANLAVLVITFTLPFFTPVSPWLRLVGPLSLVGWVIISRASVVIVDKQLRQRLALLESGGEEATVLVRMPEAPSPAENELSIELSGTIAPMSSLMEPVEITPPTYLNRPLLPRSVRAIPLAPPSAGQDALFSQPPVVGHATGLLDDTIGLNATVVQDRDAI